ncbi:single-strand binding protein [Bacillus phage DK1]|uniref:Single-stranded DNA-binding protein n=1 Tax=Bacillus phage DK1 TaxID=2500808 RepID=A0A3T0IIZ1_9CAUD|nr:single strand DNA binding protein [Bacillus phage DK1]AZU99729.1 single-strand binding protein [Bacillus phage DK1]
MMNKVILVGRTVKEGELRYTTSGKAVYSNTLAVNRDYVQEGKEREADFPQIVIWGKQAENFANYVKKGDRVGVEGQLRTRSFDELKDGQPTGKKVYVTEVLVEKFTFLQDKKEG